MHGIHVVAFFLLIGKFFSLLGLELRTSYKLSWSHKGFMVIAYVFFFFFDRKQQLYILIEKEVQKKDEQSSLQR